MRGTMHVAMRQITILRANSRIARRVIVRPDHGAQTTVLFQMALHQFERIGVNACIRIEENEYFTLRQ
jgi:hypothetical protein